MRIFRAPSGIQAPRIPTRQPVGSEIQSHTRGILEAFNRPEVGSKARIESFDLGA